jgi:hypothetical protein
LVLRHKIKVDYKTKHFLYNFIDWNPYVHPEELDIDWECLMTVIDKIESSGNEVIIVGNTCTIGPNSWKGYDKIEAVFNCIIKHLDSQNKNK